MSSQDWSYQRHMKDELEIRGFPACYTAPGSVDAWRHRRMLGTILCLVNSSPKATWLTLGDGNCGSDAHFLQSNGADVTASSLTAPPLEAAHRQGYIEKYRVENAEALSLEDGTFDYVMCKESYHHFPRPPIAFYEMWRVAKTAIVLIEPYDGGWRVLSSFKHLVKRLLRGDLTDQFEVSGNFLYRLNVREVEKMATALNGALVAMKRHNDFYYAPAASAESGSLSAESLITKLGVGVQDVLCRLGLLSYGLVTTMVFKREIDAVLRENLRQNGYALHQLPRNPYLS